MTTLIGDMTSAWTLLYEGVRLLTLIITMNIVFLGVSFVSYLIYMVLEAIGWFIVIGTRWVETMQVNIHTRSLAGVWMKESELKRATLDKGMPDLGYYRDLRCYVIRAYRTWQTLTAVMLIGAVWLIIALLFLHSVTNGAYMEGSVTPYDLALEIADNIDIILVFLAGVTGIIFVITVLMFAFRTWEFGVLEVKLFGGKSAWQVIKSMLK